MTIKISKEQSRKLIFFLDKELSKIGCDHSYRFGLKWADNNNIDRNNFIVIMEDNGCYCDCEIIYNLPENIDIILKQTEYDIDQKNPWEIPNHFIPDPEKIYSKILISKFSIENRCFAEDGEILVPAPKGAKPRKRIRRKSHHFIGIKSGLPNEIGFVTEHNGINANELAKIVRDSGYDELKNFSYIESSYYLQKLENQNVGNAVASYFIEVKGIPEKWEELRIHKIILYKKNN